MENGKLRTMTNDNVMRLANAKVNERSARMKEETGFLRKLKPIIKMSEYYEYIKRKNIISIISAEFDDPIRYV